MKLNNIKITHSGIEFTDKHGRRLDNEEAMGKIRNRVYNWILDLKLFSMHLVSLHVPFYTIRRLFFIAGGIKIGSGSVIHMGAKFFEPENIEIGHDSIIGDRAFLDGRDKLQIGNHVDIASEVMIYNSEHDINDSEFKAKNSPVTIGDYVFIGPRSIILPGVKINKGAVIAAAAVVTKDVEPFSIVAGVPAREIGKRKLTDLKYVLGRARLFQ